MNKAPDLEKIMEIIGAYKNNSLSGSAEIKYFKEYLETVKSGYKIIDLCFPPASIRDVYPECCQKTIQDFLDAAESEKEFIQRKIDELDNCNDASESNIKQYRALLDVFREKSLKLMRRATACSCSISLGMGHKIKAALGLTNHIGPYD